jgi:hypothetical protein
MVVVCYFELRPLPDCSGNFMLLILPDGGGKLSAAGQRFVKEL